MAIQITCPGCLKRFSVSEKFAGKQGPCPQCKAVINIPKLEDQVIVHAPDHSESGAVGAGGQHALKTSRRTDAKFKPILFAGVSAAVLAVVVSAIVIRSMGWAPGYPLLSLAAIALGPPLAWAGYTFLRDDELEAYRGTSLAVRVVACGLVYALLWGLFVFLGEQLFDDKSFQTPLVLETLQMIILTAGALGIGTFAAYVCFDLEPTSGVFACALFLGVCVLLRILVGLPAVPGLAAG